MPADPAGPEAIPAVYARAAEGWDRRRSRALFERGWLERFRALVPAGAPVLDLGCGGGEPIARWLIEAGFRVTGVDVAEPMLAICRRRWPGGEWLRADMRALDLGRRFGGIVAWDSFFHLDPAAQRAMFPTFARHMEPGGALLFTSGPDASGATGLVEGLPVFHASLSPADYAGCLEGAGLVARGFLAEDPDCDRHSVWLARRR
jgi:2-polyprenyl-3-methyl-5-hydroxy-6-metoxy-1,4-benzoquinol methylase